MTEFLVICMVLVPVFLAIPMLGKYMDIQHSAIQGTRYLAWERTVWTPGKKSDAQLENELRNRVFTGPATPVKAGDGKAAPASYNPLWKDVGGRPMLADYGAVNGGTGSDDGETTPGVIYNTAVSTLVDIFNTVSGWLDKIGGVRQAPFQISVKGMYSGTIGVNIAEQGATGQSGLVAGALHIPAISTHVRPNVIITDAWGASEPGGGHHCTNGQDARSELCQVASLVPTTALSGWFSTLIHDVGYVIPEFKGLDFGRIEPGAAPKDRQP
jgi:hypothetical protein